VEESRRERFLLRLRNKTTWILTREEVVEGLKKISKKGEKLEGNTAPGRFKRLEEDS